MLTNEDVAKIVAVVVTKEDIENLKQDVNGLRESVRALTISVNKLVKAVADLKTEYVAVTAKIDRHEKWIQQLAGKLGVKLEY